MTLERMIELLKIEHECVLRASADICDRDCGKCDLVQSDKDLDEMYQNVIEILEKR